MKSEPLTYRGLQLDLARQTESREYIKSFIDFAAEHHFTTVGVYLEWKIRTEVFDVGEDGYTPELLRELDDYAFSKNILLIPGISALGHCEMLLKDPRYQHLAELKPGDVDRWGFKVSFSRCLCPSHPGTRELLEKYLTACAGIFRHTPAFKIGLDEAWEVGYCDRCKATMKSYEDEGRIYAEHVIFIHDVLKKLGKTMMMSDDRIDFYPGILNKLPRDIIFSAWLYHRNTCSYLTHFLNQATNDQHKVYEEMGFRYVCLSSDYYVWGNIETYTAYGERRHPYGMQVACWEKYEILAQASFPAMAAIGEIWNEPGLSMKEAWNRAFRSVFKLEPDQQVIDAILFCCEKEMSPRFQGKKGMTSFPFFGPDRASRYGLKLALRTFQDFRGKVPAGDPQLVLDNLILNCRFALLNQEINLHCWELLKHQADDLPEELFAEIRSLGQDYYKMIHEHRRPDQAETVLGRWKDREKMLTDFRQNALHAGRIRMGLALPEEWSTMYTSIRIRTTDGNTVEIPFENLKQGEFFLFEKYYFIPADCEIDEIEISAYGYAGVGITWIEADTQKGHFVPEKLLNCTGLVEDPQYLLIQDVKFAFFGTRDVFSQFVDRKKGLARHTVVLKMKKEL